MYGASFFSLSLSQFGRKRKKKRHSSEGAEATVSAVQPSNPEDEDDEEEEEDEDLSRYNLDSDDDEVSGLGEIKFTGTLGWFLLEVYQFKINFDVTEYCSPKPVIVGYILLHDEDYFPEKFSEELMVVASFSTMRVIVTCR